MLEIIGLDENNNKIKIPLTSGAGSGNPLGTIIAVYSNHVPDGYLPCNGTTFDQTQYPALYTLLGDNHTPDLRNKAIMGANPSSQSSPASGNTSDIGDVQKASAPNIIGTGPNAPNGFRASYSGAFKDGNSYTIGYYNAPVSIQTALFDASNSGASSDHLGDNVYGAKETTDTGTELRPANMRVNFCIKATTGITENQADYVGDIIKDYVNDGESYSTDEVKTNKTWIDGKPIYRKVYTNLTQLTTGYVNLTLIGDIDKIIDRFYVSTGVTNATTLQTGESGGYIQVSHTGSGTISITAIVLEYTKTTD